MSKQIRRLVIRALDDWEQLNFYHELIENVFDEEALNELHLHQQCYLKLSAKHRKRLDATLRSLKQLVERANPTSS